MTCFVPTFKNFSWILEKKINRGGSTFLSSVHSTSRTKSPRATFKLPFQSIWGSPAVPTPQASSRLLFVLWIVDVPVGQWGEREASVPDGRTAVHLSNIKKKKLFRDDHLAKIPRIIYVKHLILTCNTFKIIYTLWVSLKVAAVLMRHDRSAERFHSEKIWQGTGKVGSKQDCEYDRLNLSAGENLPLLRASLKTKSFSLNLNADLCLWLSSCHTWNNSTV